MNKGLVFAAIGEDGATGTLDGKEFEVVAEREDENGDTEHGVVEGEFSDEERAVIYTAWLMEQEDL